MIDNSRYFPKNAKIGSITPQKTKQIKKPNKFKISNYRPLKTLNKFSKIYKKEIKDQLT